MRALSLQNKFHLQHCSLETHITSRLVAASGYICGKFYTASDTGVMSHKA